MSTYNYGTVPLYRSLLKTAFSCIGLFFLLIVLCLQTVAQNIPGVRTPLPGEENELLNKFVKSKLGIEQVELLLELGAYYLFLPGEEKDDMTKAMRYAKQAKEESGQLNYLDGYAESLLLIASIFDEDGQRQSAIPFSDSAIFYIESARLNGNINQPEREFRALLQLGRIYLLQYKFDLSEKKFLDALKLSKAKGFSNSHYTYHHLAVLEMWKGDWNKSLFYELEAVRSMESTGDKTSEGYFYFNLAFIYREVGQFQKAIGYYEMAYDFYKKNPSSMLFELISRISEAMTKLNRPADGIKQLHTKIQYYPPSTDFEKREIEYSLGTCYRVLKQYDSAEVHFLKYVEFQRKDRAANFYTAKKLLGQVYVESGNYSKAKPYLDEALASGVFSGRSLSHLYFLLYKTDSAAGNYLLAMNHIMKNKIIDEVLYREAKTRENQELQIKYETEKKDKDIKLKEKDILLLKRLSQLQQQNTEQSQLKYRYDSLAKEQNIRQLNTESAKKDKDLLLQQQRLDLLAKQDLLKQSRLQQVSFQKNVTIAGLGLLFIILILLYSQYRIKRRSNKEISNKNVSLQHLLEEKEWLLKEVHHRVKNNLHTVMSLLETQSAYLKDDALAAVQSSQHRVYAMSLIHQKLYLLEGSTNINMSVYLSELIDYLRDSFDAHQRIRFRPDIEDMQLDISKAIPVGLILNEAVTNSIKYAFPGNACGEIKIEIKRIENNLIRLSVKDNGIGLPLDWENIQKKSLGLKLMKGLSEDIHGRFSIEQMNGTKVKVDFPGELVLKESRKKNNIQKAELLTW